MGLPSARSGAVIGAAAFLVELGAQVSGYQNIYLAFALFGLAAVGLVYSGIVWFRQKNMPPPTSRIEIPQGAGFSIGNATGVRIIRPKSHDNKGPGIYVGPGSSAHIEDADTQRNEGGGIVIEGKSDGKE